ncbi:MAG: YraN family protein [Aquirufa sp.]
MAKHLRLGRRAENLATDYLRQNGYFIRERNYRAGIAEVDLIVQKSQTLCFVEVKAKKSGGFGPPEERINAGKIRRYHQAATNYQEDEAWFGEIRFDTISITFFPQAVQIEHFEDAFS